MEALQRQVLIVNNAVKEFGMRWIVATLATYLAVHA